MKFLETCGIHTPAGVIKYKTMIASHGRHVLWNQKRTIVGFNSLLRNKLRGGCYRDTVASLRPLCSINLKTDNSVPFQIADPQAFLNAIASSYSSTERIIIEYVDNAIDDIDRSVSPDFVVKVHVDIDIDSKTLWVRDNCGGMDYDGLSRIILGVGKVKLFVVFAFDCTVILNSSHSL